MMINYINANLPGVLLPAKVDGPNSPAFSRLLTEATASFSENPSPFRELVKTSLHGTQQNPQGERLVKIGTISSKNPTVSQLLFQNPSFRKECWDIVYDRQNKGKVYTRIQAGTDIYLNPDTKELLWGDTLHERIPAPVFTGSLPESCMAEKKGDLFSPAQEASAARDEIIGPDVQKEGLSESLVKAIEPMIGRKYSDVNCYELLVNGLSKLGIRYGGRNGLGRKLIDMALGEGRPMNAYLTGEGLIQASGSKVYSKSFSRIDDPVGQAGKVIEEMAPFLEKGSILSFSMESRGHTGIVSNKNGTWTYINSGVMDNPITGVVARKGVGEENLSREIENWFKRAAGRNESLVITLGKLNRNKLAVFDENEKSFVL